MCPQGHPHQWEPILLKHFPLVLKAKAKTKENPEGNVAKLKKKQIMREHTQNLNQSGSVGAYFMEHSIQH